MSRRFLLLHGRGSRRAREHWQWWLADQLRGAGEQVLYPQFPTPDRPDLTTWLELLAAEYAQLGDGERVVVCHSLGCALWYRAAASGLLRRPAGRVMLVAPPSAAVLSDPATAEFAGPWDRITLRRSARRIQLVASDNDRFSSGAPATIRYGHPLEVDSYLVAGAGHFGIADGYGPWPGMWAWCLGHLEWDFTHAPPPARRPRTVRAVRRDRPA